MEAPVDDATVSASPTTPSEAELPATADENGSAQQASSGTGKLPM